MCLKEIARSFRLHLIAWQHAAAQSEERNLKLFKLRPKHHAADHLSEQLCRTQLNPLKAMCCLQDEAFLGLLKKIGIRCHFLSIMDRIFERYFVLLSLRWRDASAV